MTIIKPMKEGPLVTQVTPNLKDPVGKDVKPEKPAFGLCRRGQSKNNPFVTAQTATYNGKTTPERYPFERASVPIAFDKAEH